MRTNQNFSTKQHGDGNSEIHGKYTSSYRTINEFGYGQYWLWNTLDELFNGFKNKFQISFYKLS